MASQKQQRETLVWHADKWPLLTAKHDENEALKRNHTMGTFNRWALQILEDALKDQEEHPCEI